MPITRWVEAADGTNICYDYDRELAVSSETLCQHFNNGYYWYRGEVEGEFAFICEYNELAPPEANQPPGTLSQIILYHSRPNFVARVHQYLLPEEQRDGAGLPLLGASGMPDPKELIEDRVYFQLRRRRKPSF